MKRIWWNYLVDAGLLISFILMFVTGIFKFPLWTRAFRPVYRTISGRTISMIHDWSVLIMGLLVLDHLALNWDWIVCMTKRLFQMSKKCSIQPCLSKKK